MKLFFYSFTSLLVVVPSLFAFQAHDQNLAYTHPAIVVSSSVSYISVQDVPAGTTITSTSFWTPLLDTAPNVEVGDPPTTDPSDSNVSNLTQPDYNGTDESNSTVIASGLSSASNEAFVRQQYLDFLGRDADDSGLSYWLSEMTAGTKTRADVVNFFVFSDEFQNQVAPVSRLYQAYFLRIPDTQGLSYWVNQKLAGVSLAEISNTFSTADEFTNMYGPKTDEEFVQLVYQNVLGRQPDGSGLSYWVDDRLGQGDSRGTVMIGFSESTEYQITTLNNIRVIAFYYGMLRRAPDSSGFSYWVAKLDAGEQPNDLINGFIASAEYQGRF